MQIMYVIGTVLFGVVAGFIIILVDIINFKGLNAGVAKGDRRKGKDSWYKLDSELVIDREHINIGGLLGNRIDYSVRGGYIHKW